MVKMKVLLALVTLLYLSLCMFLFVTVFFIISYLFILFFWFLVGNATDYRVATTDNLNTMIAMSSNGDTFELLSGTHSIF